MIGGRAAPALRRRPLGYTASATRGVGMIATRRLFAQHIARPLKGGPVDVVEAMGAVQASDLANAKWAVGVRLGDGATEASVDKALDAGTIIRTHAMRGAWQLIAAEDLRCLLKLLGPAIVASSAPVYRRLELDDDTFRRSNAAIVEALTPRGSNLTRGELGDALTRAGVSTAGERLDVLLQRAGLDSLVCNGIPRGGEYTFALLDHRVPPLSMPGRETICAVLMQRYFRSRSPATLDDFVWWSGLPAGEVEAVFESMKRGLQTEVIDGKTYFSDRAAATGAGDAAALLPAFDELLVGYRDRSAVIDPAQAAPTAEGEGWAEPVIVAGGRVIGTWRAARSAGSVEITPRYTASPNDDERAAVAAAARRYGSFFGLEASVAA